MKNGKSLSQLAAEIERQHEVKKDYIIDTRRLEMAPQDNSLALVMQDNNGNKMAPLWVNDIAHRQIGTHLGIPAKYYDKMRTDYPELLVQNVNGWMHQEPAQRMVRTLDGTARAFLSNKYRRIDNIQIAMAALPIIGQMDGANVESCEVTERRMYIKVVNRRLETEVVPGDIVQAGVMISNSETGQGAVSIQPLIYRLVCSNGMVVNDAATRRNHVGRANSAEENFELYSEETLEADDHAFMLKIQDTVKAAVEEARFHKVVGMMRDARDARITSTDIPAMVELTGREFGITKEESGGVLRHLIEGGELSLYGLSNAVTRAAQDLESYDRSTDFEIIGYNMLAMSRALWNRVNSEV